MHKNKSPCALSVYSLFACRAAGLTFYCDMFLHSLIARSAAAFGDRPPDIVEGTFSLAGFAVQAVGRVGRLYLVVDCLIYSRRAERNTGTVEYRRAFGSANIAVQNR